MYEKDTNLNVCKAVDSIHNVTKINQIQINSLKINFLMFV
mgnify:CR=1 FL=1